VCPIVRFRAARDSHRRINHDQLIRPDIRVEIEVIAARS